VGALAGVGATYLLGSSGGAGRTATTLILSGVAIASFLTAAQTYFQQRNAETLRQVYAWILGRLSTLGWGEVTMILPYVVITTVAILLHGRLLDVMSVGDEEATTLGISPGRVRILVVIAASLGTAAAVAVSGLIVFVGIIVPHTVRLLFGWSYRSVLPLSAVFGAFFLVLTDLMARTVMAPAELPIGVITAFFGAPFFVIVLRTTKRMS
jgi:iron complex transport system permease protein